MKELELTWNRTLRMWWHLFWRAFLGGGVIGGVAGFVVGFIRALAGLDQYALIVTGVIGYAISVVWLKFVLRMMLRRRYADFRLASVPIVGANDIRPNSPAQLGSGGL
jgi:hypothetical protein